jgi:hypothetical protein
MGVMSSAIYVPNMQFIIGRCVPRTIPLLVSMFATMSITPMLINKEKSSYSKKKNGVIYPSDQFGLAQKSGNF